jgi:HK97 family phage major capsid protein/HK97 family phage prohead protease
MSKTKPKPTEDTSQRFPTMLPKQFRGMDASIRAVETENGESEDNVLMFTLSSETPYERWFGIEVLDHSEAAIDMSRLKNRAPFLWNHNASEYLGVIEDAYIEEKKIHIKVRFSDRPFAKEKYADCKAGILCKTSVGYQPQDLKWTGEENNLNTYLVTKWMPLEGSLVTIPADDSVGTKDLDWQRFLRCDASELRSVTISDLPDELNKKNKPVGGNMTAVIENPTDLVLQERNRVSEIEAMGVKLNLGDLARKLIQEGTDLSAARSEFILNMPSAQKPVAAPTLGLTEKEKQRYSILKIGRAAHDPRIDLSFEREVSDALAVQMGQAPNGFYIPMNELTVGIRSQNITVPTQGGNLVQTELSTNMVEFLVNATLTGQMGMQMFTGLVGNFDLPSETNQLGYNFLGENGEADEQTATTELISFRNKTISSYSTITRNALLQQSIDVENWARRKLLLGVAEGVDYSVIAGTGTANQPRGILNTSGIQSVAIGANGGAITFDLTIDMRTKVAGKNALINRIGYMTNSKVVGDLMKLKETTGGYLWKGTDTDMGIAVPGRINNIPVGETQQIPSNLTKGSGTNLSAMILADWSYGALAMWGVLDIEANRNGRTFRSGGVEIVAFQTFDFQILKKDSFCVITDIVTST